MGTCIYLSNYKKYNLPTKICIVCNLPLVWRKKWEKNWENIKYCSNKCSRNKNLRTLKDIAMIEVKKISSKSRHKEILNKLRLKKLEEKMKTNIKKRKKILKK